MPNQNYINDFRDFSSDGLRKVSTRLPNYLRNNRWLGANNRYLFGCIEKIENEIKPPTFKIKKPSHLADYIAASIPLHCIDGWNFLGKALICENLGDSDGAKHFAYYAELRAAMSILGFGGMGIFCAKNFEIGQNGKLCDHVINVKAQTHGAVNKGLAKWIASPESNDIVQKVIRPEGIPLEIWLGELTRNSSTPSWITKEWLDDWGYDLKNLENDKTARELSSYRPTRLKNKKWIRNDQTTNLLINIWQMSLPVNNGGLSIDLYLLRKIIDSYYKSIGQRKTKKKIEDILNRLNINGFQKTRLLDILSESGAKSFPLVLRESRIKGKFDDPRYSIQMLSRAFLLLRLATGASMKLMEDNHLSKSDIEFWWNPFGHDHGLWDANYTNPLLDMWVDVEDALNRLQSNSAPATYLEGRAINARDILTLGGCERVGLSRICI